MQYYIFEYEIGDTGGDGHERMESGYIKVNHSNEELLAAMKTFKEKTGCEWEHWFEEAEENFLDIKETNKIFEYIGEKKREDYHFYNKKLCLSGDSDFIALLMAICRVALPDLDWSWHTPKCDGEAFFSGMGYGLFY